MDRSLHGRNVEPALSGYPRPRSCRSAELGRSTYQDVRRAYCGPVSVFPSNEAAPLGRRLFREARRRRLMISEPPVLLGPQRTSRSKTATLVNRSWTFPFSTE